MKKTSSLRLNRQFNFLYRKGRCEVSDSIVLYYRQQNHKALHLGITVSKKIGKAVTRNRVRRLIKENFRLRELKIKDGYDLVFVARTKAAKSTFREIGAAMDYLLKKSNLYLREEA